MKYWSGRHFGAWWWIINEVSRNLGRPCRHAQSHLSCLNTAAITWVTLFQSVSGARIRLANELDCDLNMYCIHKLTFERGIVLVLGWGSWSVKIFLNCLPPDSHKCSFLLFALKSIWKHKILLQCWFGEEIKRIQIIIASLI